jgi:hypothetical protein
MVLKPSLLPRKFCEMYKSSPTHRSPDAQNAPAFWAVGVKRIVGADLGFTLKKDA